jgi:hypothetical protein
LFTCTFSHAPQLPFAITDIFEDHMDYLFPLCALQNHFHHSFSGEERKETTSKTNTGGWIILGWTSEKQNGVMWTGLVWLRIGTSGGLLWMCLWMFGFYKMLGSSRVAAKLAASREGRSAPQS